jgi:hypothetical protein
MKKTNKENPITFFRKANEAREAKVKNSIKQAKYGISMGEDPENMIINKPGSKGGYKKPISTESDTYRQKLVDERYNSAVKELKDNLRKAYNEGTGNNINRKNTDLLNEYIRNNPITPKKKGGAVKRKK